MRDNYEFLATVIGSLPHSEPNEAIDLIFDTIPNAPVCPQLSKVSPNEDMLIQYTENFPGIQIDEISHKRYVNLNSDEYFSQLEELFTDYEEIISSTELNSSILNKYSVSKEYLSSFKLFCEKLKQTTPKYSKWQVVGPFTFGTSTLDEESRCAFYDETYREVIAKTLALKALWFINEVKKTSPLTQNIIFIDEPTMSQLGTSAFMTVTPEDVQSSINIITDTLHHFGVKVGIHCCGKADWSVVLNTNIDIVNFDAFFFSENFSLFYNDIKRFLDRNGVIAWGIVPTLDVEALETTSPQKLISLWENAKNLLVTKGIDEKTLLKSSILTPSCGAGSLSVKNSELALKYLNEVSKELNKKYTKELI